jgi:hypothetical protein
VSSHRLSCLFCLRSIDNRPAPFDPYFVFVTDMMQCRRSRRLRAAARRRKRKRS